MSFCVARWVASARKRSSQARACRLRSASSRRRCWARCSKRDALLGQMDGILYTPRLCPDFLRNILPLVKDHLMYGCYDQSERTTQRMTWLMYLSNGAQPRKEIIDDHDEDVHRRDEVSPLGR